MFLTVLFTITLIIKISLLSLTLTDLHEEVIPETGILTMTPTKLEVSFKKESAGDITWSKVYGETKPILRHEGIV